MLLKSTEKLNPQTKRKSVLWPENPGILCTHPNPLQVLEKNYLPLRALAPPLGVGRTPWREERERAKGTTKASTLESECLGPQSRGGIQSKQVIKLGHRMRDPKVQYEANRCVFEVPLSSKLTVVMITHRACFKHLLCIWAQSPALTCMYTQTHTDVHLAHTHTS